MRFANENAGKKDQENFCFRAMNARNHEPKGSPLGRLRSRLPLPPTDPALQHVGIHGSWYQALGPRRDLAEYRSPLAVLDPLRDRNSRTRPAWYRHERARFVCGLWLSLRTPYIAMFVDTEIRNIERAIVGNFDECKTMIPPVYASILRSHVAQATR
jgi:hypothetical protein